MPNLPMLLAVLTLAAASAIAEATPELPNWTPTYKMSESTTIMPCNYSGYCERSRQPYWRHHATSPSHRTTR